MPAPDIITATNKKVKGFTPKVFSDSALHEAGHQLDKQGRKAVKETEENISKAKDYFKQKKAEQPIQRAREQAKTSGRPAGGSHGGRAAASLWKVRSRGCSKEEEALRMGLRMPASPFARSFPFRHMSGICRRGRLS